MRGLYRKGAGRAHGPDYFGARCYAPIPGRFLSPDPLLDSADPADPQSWNRYSYVFNRPMNSIDPNGEKVVKVIKLIAKGGDLGATFAGVVEDFNTLTDSEAGLGSRALAGLSLLSELLPVSGRDALDIGSFAAGIIGGRKLARAGRPLEDRVSDITGIPVNRGPGRDTIPGTGPGGIRIPDLKAFGLDGSIALRGSIIEVKDVARLEGRKQIREIVKFARVNGLTIEIFVRKGTQLPTKGPLAREIRQRKLVKVIRVDSHPSGE